MSLGLKCAYLSDDVTFGWRADSYHLRLRQHHINAGINLSVFIKTGLQNSFSWWKYFMQCKIVSFAKFAQTVKRRKVWSELEMCRCFRNSDSNRYRRITGGRRRHYDAIRNRYLYLSVSAFSIFAEQLLKFP